MSDLFTLLSDKEIEYLDQFLLDRIDEDTDVEDQDEGVLNISELDGLFTAIVSGPTMIPPSQWLKVVWGDFEPVWESEKEFTKIFSLLMRHMNNIAAILMEYPEDFEPLFMEHIVNEKTFAIVDEWCEGYQRGVAQTSAEWDSGGLEMKILLTPILAFTSETDWRGHDFNEAETENIRNAIEPNVREIHAYWLMRRSENISSSQPARRSAPRVGRNDLCPCGSGKKYKKCCLH